MSNAHFDTHSCYYAHANACDQLAPMRARQRRAIEEPDREIVTHDGRLQHDFHSDTHPHQASTTASHARCLRGVNQNAAPAAADRRHPPPRWHGRAARRVWSSAGWAVRLGWFRVCVRTSIACVWFRAVCASVCVYGTCLVSVAAPGVRIPRARKTTHTPTNRICAPGKNLTTPPALYGGGGRDTGHRPPPCVQQVSAIHCTLARAPSGRVASPPTHPIARSLRPAGSRHAASPQIACMHERRASF